MYIIKIHCVHAKPRVLLAILIGWRLFLRLMTAFKAKLSLPLSSSNDESTCCKDTKLARTISLSLGHTCSSTSDQSEYWSQLYIRGSVDKPNVHCISFPPNTRSHQSQRENWKSWSFLDWCHHTLICPQQVVARCDRERHARCYVGTIMRTACTCDLYLVPRVHTLAGT